MKHRYAIKSNGKDYPRTGAIPNGADTVATKLIARNTVGATSERGGKQVETTRFAVSRDGKLQTINAKGTKPHGQSFNNVIVWDKQ